MNTLRPTPGYIVLTETDGTLGWLCQHGTFDDSARAMDEWLNQPAAAKAWLSSRQHWRSGEGLGRGKC